MIDLLLTPALLYAGVWLTLEAYQVWKFRIHFSFLARLFLGAAFYAMALRRISSYFEFIDISREWWSFLVIAAVTCHLIQKTIDWRKT